MARRVPRVSEPGRRLLQLAVAREELAARAVWAADGDAQRAALEDLDAARAEFVVLVREHFSDGEYSPSSA